MRASTNKTTLQKAIRGDEDAFTQLYDENLESIFRFVAVRVGDRDTAEDLTATIFMHAWERLAHYEDRGLPFRAWLFRIARNAVIDNYRTSKEVAPLEAATNTPDGKENIADVVANRIELERVARSLDVLTAGQREVFMLKMVNGLSTEEVAKVLRKREGAVRALQMRGLQALSKELQTKEERGEFALSAN